MIRSRQRPWFIDRLHERLREMESDAKEKRRRTKLMLEKSTGTSHGLSVDTVVIENGWAYHYTNGEPSLHATYYGFSKIQNPG